MGESRIRSQTMSSDSSDQDERQLVRSNPRSNLMSQVMGSLIPDSADGEFMVNFWESLSIFATSMHDATKRANERKRKAFEPSNNTNSNEIDPKSSPPPRKKQKTSASSAS